MIAKHKYFLFLTLAVALMLTSCITDDSSEGGTPLPTLAVEGIAGDDMPVYNIYLGNECVLSPSINYTGSDTLTYRWQVGTYANGTKGALEDAGSGPVLHHNFTSGGSYYVHLTVTDGRVGTTADYQVNVNRTFEEGWLLSATDADGAGNLTFLKALTPEEEAAGTGEIVMEHAMERMNADASENGLVGAVIAQDTYPTTITRLIVSTGDRCYFLDPNELTILSASSYGEVYQGFNATKMFNDAQTPFVYDAAMGKFVHINVKNQFPFEYQYFVGYSPEDIISQKTYSSYSFASTAYARYYLDYTNSTVAQINYYGSSYFPNTGAMLAGHTLITAFCNVRASGWVTPWNILTRYGDNLYLWTNSSYSGMAASDFRTQTTAYSDDLAIPERGSWLVGSRTQNRLYYALGNRVYVFLPGNAFALPKLNEYALQVPDGEEITCMDTYFSTDELFVATYNSTTRRGSFYVYDCADVRTDNAASVQPKKQWKNCTGRVKSILYKPSIQ